MPSIAETFATAVQSHQAGQCYQAEQLCHQVLREQPTHVEAMQLLGVLAFGFGKLEDAIAFYQRSLAVAPQRADTLNHLAVALHQQGSFALAIAHYESAIALAPFSVEIHYNLANAWQDQQQGSKAIYHYQMAIALQPNYAAAHCSLANALRLDGQTALAMTHFQRAIAIEPNQPTAHYHLGNDFKTQGQLEIAIAHYTQAITLNPNYTDALFDLGLVFDQLNQPSEAEIYLQRAIALSDLPSDRFDPTANYRQAIAQKPDSVDARIRLGRLLWGDKQYQEAEITFRQALQLQPELAIANLNLAQLLVAQGAIEEAIPYFQTAQTLDPRHIQATRFSLLALPRLYDAPEQLDGYRQRFCRGLNQLIQHTPLETPQQQAQALASLTNASTNFYLAYQGFNDRGLQRKYGKFLSQIVAASYPQWTQPLAMPSIGDKIRIGYVSVNLQQHTVGYLSLGWLKYCDRSQFEIYTYYLGDRPDSMTQEFQASSDVFRQLGGNLAEICQQIRADDLHVLIFIDLGMDNLTLQLAGLRLASVQCTSWAHPIASGLATIDYFLSSDLMEPDNGQQHYSETLVKLPNIGVCYPKPRLPESTKTRAEFGLRENAIAYLCCQSLYKYLPQFDVIFARIAEQIPQSQFIFLEHSASKITAQFQARLQKAFAAVGLNSQEYCLFLPRLNHQDYLHINQLADIFLDSFSWSGGKTTLEAIACGLPVVTCPGEFMRGRHAYGILRMLGITETIAHNEADYIEIAVRLGLDANWRQVLRQKIHAQHDKLYSDRTCIVALETFYKQVAGLLTTNSKQ
jgi:protein O-GlcNAc transferase